MTSLKMTLSMHSALASTPEPTYGTSSTSSSPLHAAVLAEGAVQRGKDRVGVQQTAARAQRHLLALARPGAVAAEIDPENVVSRRR